MNHQKTTKQTLTANIIVLLCCVAMLILATYAWFTDSATVNGNKIVTGNLDITLLDKNDNSVEGKTLNWIKSDGNELKDTDVWEYGSTYNLESFKIKNQGTMDLKYTMSITGDVENSDILKIIDFSVTENSSTVDLSQFNGKLKPGDETGLITISGKMKENLDNAFNVSGGMTIDNIKITVNATEINADDSDDSDNSDSVTVSSETELKQELENGGTITLGSDIQISPAGKTNAIDDTLLSFLTISKDTTLDLAGKTIGYSNASGYTENLVNVPVLMTFENNSTLTIDGNGTMSALLGKNTSYVFCVTNNGKLVINSGNFYGSPRIFYVMNGALEISGGFFDTNLESDSQLIYVDETGNNSVTIKGGTFVNYNPKAYVPEGYSVVSSTQSSGDIWYTVGANN